jgi:HSP20 family protein
MDRLMNEMNSMVDQMRHMWWDTPTLGTASDTESDPETEIEPWRGHSTDLNLTVEPTDEGYTVLADIPGFEREELDLRFDDGMLTIVGSHETSDGSIARSRRLHRQVTIPGSVITDDATASYRNGVLEIRLPTETSHADNGSRIEIED